MPTAIEWTDETLNPIALPKDSEHGRWACAKISPGCDYCYASRLNIRYGGPAFGADDRTLTPAANGTQLASPIAGLELKTDRLIKAIGFTKSRKIFVCDMTDLFGRWIHDDWIDQVFGMVAAAPQHHFQILTKRADRMEKYFADPQTQIRIAGASGTLQAEAHKPFTKWKWPLDNLWLGVSVETNAYRNRINHLLACPAAVHYISGEPLLGPLELSPWLNPSPRTSRDHVDETPARIDWVIVGGESGGPTERALCLRHQELPGATGFPNRYDIRPEALTWVRDLRDQTKAAGAAFFFKQWGGPQSHCGGNTLDGRQWKEFPTIHSPNEGRMDQQFQLGDRVKIRTTARRCHWDLYGEPGAGHHASAAIGITGTIGTPQLGQKSSIPGHALFVEYDRTVQPNHRLGGFYGGWYAPEDLSPHNEGKA